MFLDEIVKTARIIGVDVTEFVIESSELVPTSDSSSHTCDSAGENGHRSTASSRSRLTPVASSPDQPKTYPVTVRTLEDLVTSYIAFISESSRTWKDVKVSPFFDSISDLLERIYCVPAKTAQVERVFYSSGLLSKSYCSSLPCDSSLNYLMFLKCNADL